MRYAHVRSSCKQMYLCYMSRITDAIITNNICISQHQVHILDSLKVVQRTLNHIMKISRGRREYWKCTLLSMHCTINQNKKNVSLYLKDLTDKKIDWYLTTGVDR